MIERPADSSFYETPQWTKIFVIRFSLRCQTCWCPRERREYYVAGVFGRIDRSRTKCVHFWTNRIDPSSTEWKREYQWIITYADFSLSYIDHSAVAVVQDIKPCPPSSHQAAHQRYIFDNFHTVTTLGLEISLEFPISLENGRAKPRGCYSGHGYFIFSRETFHPLGQCRHWPSKSSKKEVIPSFDSEWRR